MKEYSTKDGMQAVIKARTSGEQFTRSEALVNVEARLNFIKDEIDRIRQTRPELPTFKYRRAIISEVVKVFRVSTSQAAIDYEMTCDLYQVEHVGIQLQYALSSALKDIEEDMDAAREAGDHSSVAKYHRAKAEYLKLYPKETVNLAALPFAQIRMVFDPELVNSSVKGMNLQQLYEWTDGVIAKEKKLMSDVMSSMAETIEEEGDE